MIAKPNLLSISIAIGLMAAGSFVQAQETSTPAPPNPVLSERAEKDSQSSKTAVNLESVSVTARGIEEPLQAMPLPITAVTRTMIENKGFEDISDIASFSPGFTYHNSRYGRSDQQIVIRGMSNIRGNPNAAFFIDGIYTDGSIADYGVENLDRVEVIRGPQAAMFGRQTFSGAVNFITQIPGSNPGGTLTFGGGSHGQYKYSGRYSNTAADGAVGYDVSFLHRGHDNTFYNPVSGKKDIGGFETTGIMASAIWRATPDFNVTARVSKLRTKDDPAPATRIGSSALNCYLPDLNGNTIGGVPVSDNRRKGYICGTVKAPTQVSINTPAFELAGYPAGSNSDRVRTSLVAEYHFPNYWTLQSTSAYNQQKNFSAIDQDGSGVRGLGGAFETISQSRGRDWSQDLRLTTDLEKPIYAAVGVHYYQQKSGPGASGDLSGFALVPDVPPGPYSLIPNHPQGQVANKSIYGLVNWDINDRWTASFEGRYATDEISVAGVDSKRLNFDGVPQILTNEYALSDSFTNFTPRVTLGYQWRDNVRVYGMAARGNKPGGFNIVSQRAGISDEERAKIEGEGRFTYDEESAWNYELGLKSDWLDNRLRVNASVYFIDWIDQQLTETRATPLINGDIVNESYIMNVGKSRNRGFELESQWAFAEGWLGTLAYSFIDAEILNFADQDHADLLSDGPYATLDNPIANAKGNQLPLVSRNTFAVGLMYEGQLANGWGWNVNGDVSYQGPRYVQIHNLLRLPASTTAQFRASVDPSENWRISAYVNNAFNETAAEGTQRTVDPIAALYIPALPPDDGYQRTNYRDFTVTARQPRMWGVEVRYRF
ncbi:MULTISPECIES: TonB-dependent receptor [Lysobacteraceae]|uniref:TonB-dependent receptor n=1 Tax=Novilysobacter avium TaxID=2781023 RepID=A0A7S6UKH3_9GAMM|nr:MULTISPECIES: TonB-dependent receptor [Lysobacter]QOW21967.1 TonB-dependent receptor [Lysobacter avium]QOW24437.1 TonB-dependent receptor [Lysobacter sp. H23M47]